VFYLSTNHEIYELLTDDAKLKIQHCIETDNVGRTQGWFTKSGLDEHFNDLVTWIESDDHPTVKSSQWKAVLDISDSIEWQEMFCKVIASYYAASSSYDQADVRLVGKN
jgi:hypothetical protein